MEASTQTEQIEAEGQVAESTEASPAAAEGTEGPQAPDVSEQLEAIRSRLDTIAPEQQGQTPEAGDLSPEDLIGLLSGEDDEQYGEQPHAQQPGENEQPEELDDEALGVIRNVVADIVGPELDRLELRDRQREIKALTQEYPDLTKVETLEQIRAHLEPFAEVYGDGVFSDPRFIKTAHLALRNQAAAANETPAEEARGQGATLETGAGAQGDAGEGSFEEEFINEVVNAQGGGGGHFGP